MSYLKEHDQHEGGVSFSVVYLSSYLGSVQMEICNGCGYEVASCTHEKNSWYDENGEPLPQRDVPGVILYGKNLFCDLCGTEGT